MGIYMRAGTWLSMMVGTVCIMVVSSIKALKRFSDGGPRPEIQ